MTAPTQTSETSECARYAYRLRVSSAARAVLEAEWDRCRWVWNECVARSKQAHRDHEPCGPARLDRMLTAARAVTPWLRAGSCVPQQQTIRDFGKARARQRQDTGRKWAKKVVTDHDAIAVEDFRPRFLAKTTMARKAADATIGATKRALVEMARKHQRTISLVHPAHTTMDCVQCGARTKHALPLSQRTYACAACGTVSPGTRTPPA